MNLKHFMLTAVTAGISLSGMAQAQVETRAFYSTNAEGAVGKPATITIDGKFADWSEDMIIATCGANDMGTTFKGSHENCVIDAYALYAAWDDANLYLAWQMVNTGDTWAREGDGPLTDGGRIGDVPFVVALSVNPSMTAMSGLLDNGNCIWNDGPGHGVVFDREKVHVSHLLYMSAKPGQGAPGVFTAGSANGATNYGANCKLFSNLGITYAMAEGFQPSHLWRQRTCADWADATTLISDPSIVNNIYDADNYDNLMAGPIEGLKPHDTKYDSFYEMKIPLASLGITRAWLEENGIGVRVIGTRGESGIDCIPHDPSMADNIFKEYAKDPSTTGEKDDLDTITYALADVAKVRDLGNITPPDPIDPVDPDPIDPDPVDPDPVDPDPIEPTDGFNVYYDNSVTSWTTPHIHYWGVTESKYPGVAMKPYKDAVWVYRVPAGTSGILFNAGDGDASKTKDMSAVADHWYDKNGDKGLYSGASSVAGIAAESVEVRYYNLQGIEVANPAHGTYIVRTATGARKVLIP